MDPEVNISMLVNIKAMKYVLTFICLVILLWPVHGHTYKHEEVLPCNPMNGTVMKIVNDEEFTISICDASKVFRALSYCYEVEEEDEVIFDSITKNCKILSITVIRNEVQCGVLCL
jgi:hypothetical protein